MIDTLLPSSAARTKAYRKIEVEVRERYGHHDVVGLIDGNGSRKLVAAYDAWGERTASGMASDERFATVAP